MELLKSRVPGLKAVHVPYQGNPQVVTDLIGNQIQMALIPPGIALPQVQAGKVKAIGLTSGRSALAPDLPPLADAGVQRLQPRSLDRAARPGQPVEGRRRTASRTSWPSS